MLDDKELNLNSVKHGGHTTALAYGMSQVI